MKNDWSRDQSECNTTWWIIAIPKANCVFPGCFTSRYTKHKDIGIFKLPSRSGDFYKQWKNDFLSVLCKYREADDNLKKRISSGDIYFCERHFVKEDIEFTSKIVSDFPLVFVLLCKDDIWLMSFKTLARYHLCITIKIKKV